MNKEQPTQTTPKLSNLEAMAALQEALANPNPKAGMERLKELREAINNGK